MARTRLTKPMPVSRAAGNHLPLWLVAGLAGAIGLLVYGAMVPKTPSAFDRPEAQLPFKSPNPWDPIHSM